MTNNNGNNHYLVVLGVGSDNKPHAAKFKPVDETLARKAAELMEMRIGRANNEPALKLVRKLPQARVFGSGKAFVPLVKENVYQELLKVLGFDEPAASDQQQSTEPNGKIIDELTKVDQPDPWAGVGIGSVVLALEQDRDGAAGWFEAVVVAVSKDAQTLSLRWRDFPKTKKFARPRHKVGLLASVG